MIYTNSHQNDFAKSQLELALRDLRPHLPVNHERLEQLILRLADFNCQKILPLDCLLFREAYATSASGYLPGNFLKIGISQIYIWSQALQEPVPLGISPQSSISGDALPISLEAIDAVIARKKSLYYVGMGSLL